MYNILPQIYVDFWSRRGRDRMVYVISVYHH